MTENNITFRSRKMCRTISYESINNVSTHDSDVSLDSNEFAMHRSLDLTTKCDTEVLESMRVEINNLKQELESAHYEIDSLVLQNNELKSEIATKNQQVETLRAVCTSPIVKKRDVTNRTPRSVRKIANARPSKSIPSTKKPTSDNLKCQDVFPDRVSNRHNKATQTTKNHDQTPQKHKRLPASVPPVRKHDQYAIPKTVATSLKNKNKLCILSTNKYNRSLSSIDDVFAKYFTYCHYVIPNSTLTQFLNGIEEKLKGFTLTDYCLIFIGENHIITNENNYINIINSLNESLRKITHTNVVVCLPTYKIGSPIYNFKVEMFSNLLQLDNQNHKYAYIFDSNRALTHDMFSYITGRINKQGIKNIYDNIMSNILVDLHLYCPTNTNTNNNNTQDCDEMSTASIVNEHNSSLKENSIFFRL